MQEKLKSLPLKSFESFVADPRNPASAESYLRRTLEALLDLKRHILAKGFGLAVTEYREIAQRLAEQIRLPMPWMTHPVRHDCQETT
jgi:hypothetical protein